MTCSPEHSCRIGVSSDMPLPLSHHTTYSYFCKSMSKHPVHHFPSCYSSPLYLGTGSLWMCLLIYYKQHFSFYSCGVCVFVYNVSHKICGCGKLDLGIFSICLFCIWTHIIPPVANTHWAPVVLQIKVSPSWQNWPWNLLLLMTDICIFHVHLSLYSSYCCVWRRDLGLLGASRVSCLFSCKCF